MLNALLLILCIYVAIIAAAVTLMVVACSGWYIDKCMKMTGKIINKFEDDCE